MMEPLDAIRSYVLNPDGRGLHLRQLAEVMGDSERSPELAGHRGMQEAKVAAAATVISRFIHLVWGLAGPEEYAPRTYEMLLRLRDRMRGMDDGQTWHYALTHLGRDIRQRLARAARLTIDPELETALVHAFFDDLQDHEYLHDVAETIMDLHWQRWHGPEALEFEQMGPNRNGVTSRGEVEIERHLKRVALESLATYVEQENIARGNIEEPTDPTIVFRDRLDIQAGLGAKDARTWEESARRIADQVERRFGTSAARRQARSARLGWKAVAETSD